MKTVSLEKRIFLGIVLAAGVILIAGTYVFLSKRMGSGEQPQRERATGTAAPGAGEASSAIVVGAAKNEEAPSRVKGALKEVTWEELYKLDYKTGSAPDSLKKLNNTKVRIPGFIVPLSDDMRSLKEFLLVPNAQACIHVPPPPPNLIVYVVLNHPIPVEQVTNPSWLEGTLTIEKSESDYGAAGYKMKADKMEEYKF